MSEPFKNLFNEELINQIIHGILMTEKDFQAESFKRDIFCPDWDVKELKERMSHIALMLGRYLPDDYSRSLDILKAASPGLNGLGHMCFPAYVELFGLERFDESVEALEYLTSFSSSEFAVRPFIIKYGPRMMDKMLQWSLSDNEHVRRLASEGCRPRLPWAIALPDFKNDPDPVLPILENLKNDPSEYVRRSVANNLNDISKDNLSILYSIAKRWLGNNGNTDRLVKHACRTMLKKGDIEFLKLFGFADTDHLSVRKFAVQKTVREEDSLGFSFTVESDTEPLGKLRLEYAVDFLKKNGTFGRKVFKISESEYYTNSRKVEKRHSFKTVTTRTHYPGEHRLALIVNGKEMGIKSFILQGEAES